MQTGSYLHDINSMDLQERSRNNSKVDNVTNRLTTTLFIIYLIALYWILLFKLGVRFSYMATRTVNLIPFSNPFSSGTIDIVEIILNVVVFVPLGLYTGILFERWTFGKKAFFFIVMSFIVEALQFIFAVGAFDVTDIITNTSGGIIGWMIFKAIEKAFNNRVKAQKFINIVAVIGTVVIISLLLLLRMNMLPVRYQ